MKRLLITIAIAGLLFSSCSNSGTTDSEPPEGVGESFFLNLHGAVSTLHIAGSLELWLREKGKHVTVWNHVNANGLVATNGICLFNGGLSSERKWNSYPALLAYRSPGPVVEISERLTQKYCKEKGLSYENERGTFVYGLPEFTNGTFVVMRHTKPIVGLKNEYAPLSVKLPELIEIIESVKQTGVKRKYAGIEYRIADPVDQ